jgi:hypothetical protein
MATSQNGRNKKKKTHQDWGFKFDFWDFPSHSPSPGWFTESFTVSFSEDSPESSIAGYWWVQAQTEVYSII